MNKPTLSITDALGGQILVFDGAMGTELYRRGAKPDQAFEMLNLTDPALVLAVHSESIEAGVDVLTTNTFAANRAAFSNAGMAHQVREVNAAAVALARRAIEESGAAAYIAGSIGPSALKLHGSDADASAIIEEQVSALAEAGVDLIIFETLPARLHAETCARIMNAHPGLPFILSYSLRETGESLTGERGETLFTSLPEGVAPPTAWGLNCGLGPDAMLSVVERVVHATSLPLVVQPNAGLPKEVDGRPVFMAEPEYMARYAHLLIELGVAAVGGCCGASPAHMREIVRRVKPLMRSRRSVVVTTTSGGAEPKEPTPFAERSRLAKRLATKQWITTVEILPPRGYDLTDTIEKAKRLYRNGIDALNLPDGPRASSRLSPLITAHRIQQSSGIEVILHVCARDRNLIGIQSDLLACAACEIRNLLFITGDPPKLGDYPFASGVFDVDAVGLCAMQRQLNGGVDLGGHAITPATHAVIGVGADPTALDQKREIRRVFEKADAGAEFAITQPVFDVEALSRFLDAIEPAGLSVMAGVWPLASLRNAAFLQNEVPGVCVPDCIMDRMAASDSKEAQRQTGIDIAREMIAAMRDRISGVQISAPFGNVDIAMQVAEG